MSIALQNDHNVYILGAGFSRAAGLPLISDFLLRMRDSHEWLVGLKRTVEAEAVAKVLQFRLDAASAAYWVNLDLENIEELFSLASASKGGMDQHIRLAIAATLDFARKISSKKHHMRLRGNSKLFVRPAANGVPGKFPQWAKPVGDLSVVYAGNDELGPFDLGLYEYYVARLLGMFQNGSPRGENTFISFNYDTILEDALRNLGVSFCYGFKPKTVNFYAKADEDVDDLAIRVLKLHGSVNWARRKGRGRSLTVFANYERVREAELVPELIPPTWKKIFQNQLEAVWEVAVQRLNTATRIVILGFSMPPTDRHFQYLMAAGLQQNVSLRQILFVNPMSKEELEPRVRKVLREASVNSKQIDFATIDLHNFVSDDRHLLHGIGRPFELGVTVRTMQV